MTISFHDSFMEKTGRLSIMYIDAQARRKKMGWIENLLIIAGISLDIFGAMECQGSLVKKVDKKHLAIICGLVALWQLVALFVGHFLSELLYLKTPGEDETLMGHVIAIVIFFGLGIHLIVKAIKNETVVERCEADLGFKPTIRMVALTSIYTILAGLAFGFLGTSFIALLAFIIVFSILFVIAGMYTGYHFGFEQKTKAYIIGSVLLWIAGVDVIVRCVMDII